MENFTLDAKNMAPIGLFKLLYFVQFGGYGILSPYMPIFYESLTLSKSQIGILTMMPNVFSFLFAPVFGFIGDKFNARCEVLVSAMVASTVTTLAALYMPTFRTQLPVVVLSSIFRSPIGPGIDAIVMLGLDDKTMYGAMRLWGAISFGFCSLLGGYLTSSPLSHSSSHHSPFVVLFYAYALAGVISGYLIVCLLNEEQQARAQKDRLRLLKKIDSLQLSRTPSTSTVASTTDGITNSTESSTAHKDDSGHSIELSVPNPQEKGQLSSITSADGNDRTEGAIVRARKDSHASTEGHEQARRGSIMTALREVLRAQPSVLVFALVVFLSGFGAGAIDSFLFLRIKELGGSGLVMGVARFITCAAEVPMFQVAGGWQKKYGTWAMITLTQFAFVVRFVYYSLLRRPWLVLPCEVLNGLTFAVTWSVSCTYANEIAPPGCQSVMQALLEGLHFGMGCGVGALVGGFVYESLGAVRLFQLCALLSALSTVLSAVAWRVCGTPSPPSAAAGEGETAIVSTSSRQSRLTELVGKATSTVPAKGPQYSALQQFEDTTV